MSDKNSILLISDDKNFAEVLKSKLIFLRKDDAIITSNFDEAEQNLKLSLANIVLVHESTSKTETSELIKFLRQNKDICIILLAKAYNEEFILTCYDIGIDDFAMSNAEAFELVIRVVNNIKHNSIKLQALQNSKILEQLHVTDETTGIYNYNYAQQVIENAIDNNLYKDGIFMVISPSESTKLSFSLEKMSNAISKSVRVNDVVTFGRGARFYIFLPKSDINDALVVLNKIKENYGENIEICAGISGIANKSFSDFEKDALQALSDALATNASYILADDKEETLDEWLEDTENEPQNYKIFKQIFNKKLEKVISPVFFRLQKTWENKLFETEIEQSTSDGLCAFHLKNKKQDSTLRIIYPGFAKIIITITHEGLDSPENDEIQLPLTKVTQKELINIIENFIKDFKNTAE